MNKSTFDLVAESTQSVGHDLAASFPGESIAQTLEFLRREQGTLLRSLRTEGVSEQILDRVEQFLLRVERAGRLLDRDEERELCQSYLDYWITKLWSSGRERGNRTLAEFDPSLIPNLPDERCPYKGLDAFGAADGHYFYGREKLVRKLLVRLETSRLLCVVGPSGCGKSSLVLAGLMPEITHGGLASVPRWSAVLKMVPGMTPLRELARALRPAMAATPLQIADDAQALRESQQRLRLPPGDEPVLLVVDQAEEIFTLCDNEAERTAFLRCMVHLLQTPSPRHTILLTVRSDLTEQFRQDPTLGPLWDQAEVQLSSLSQEELRDAILRPAEQIGLRIDREVIERIVHEIQGEPAGLPLLQFALLSLWERRERDRITVAAYEAIGGCRRALERSADALYEGMLTEDQQCMRRILLALLQPGEGTEATRRRVSLDALYYLGDSQERVERVLQKLIAARLVRCKEGFAASDTMLELAHEALARNWRLVSSWLAEEGSQLRQRRRLSAAVQEWRQHGCPPSLLWTPPRLEEASHILNLEPAERQFLQASRQAQEENERRQREAAEQARELERARALAHEQSLRAEAESLAANRLRWLSAGFFVIAVLLALVTLLLRYNQQERQRLALAESARKSAVQEKEREERMTALERARWLHTQGGREAEALREVAKAVHAPDGKDSLVFPAHLPLLAAVTAAHDRFITEPLGARGELLAISTSGALLFIATETSLALHDGHSGKLLTRLDCADCKYTTEPSVEVGAKPFKSRFILARFSSDERRVLAIDNVGHESSNRVLVWDVRTGQKLMEVPSANKAAFVKDGTALSTAGYRPGIELWNIPAEKPEKTLPPPRGSGEVAVLQLIASPNGKHLLGIFTNGGAHLWEVGNMTHQEMRVTKNGQGIGRPDQMSAGAFSPDGTHVLIAAGQVAWLFELASPSQPHPFVHGHEVESVQFSPTFQEDRYFSTRTKTAKDTSDGFVFLWSADNNQIRFAAPARSDASFIKLAERSRAPAIVFSGVQNDIAIRQSSDGYLIEAIPAGEFANEGIHAVPTGDEITAVHEKSLRIWRRNNQSRVIGDKSEHAAFCMGGSSVATIAEQHLLLFDMHGEKKPDEVFAEGSTAALACASHRPLALTAHDAKILNWDLSSTPPTSRPVASLESAVFKLAYALDGSRFAAVTMDGKGAIYDAATGKRLAMLHIAANQPAASLHSIVYSPDGRLIATTSEDGKIQLWRAQDGMMVKVVGERPGKATTVSFDKDSRWLISGDGEGTVYANQIAGSGELPWKTAPGRSVTAVAFSPTHAELFAIGRDDGSLTLGLRSKEMEPLTLQEKDVPIMSLAFSPDGKFLIIARGGLPARRFTVPNLIDMSVKVKKLAKDANVVEPAIAR